MGDMNAKVGNDNSGYQLVMGKHGIGCMNENGERFADTCADYNLVIASATPTCCSGKCFCTRI